MPPLMPRTRFIDWMLAIAAIVVVLILFSVLDTPPITG
jgi:hypothetical protein